MNKYIIIIIELAFITGFMFAVVAAQTQIHESTHQQIYKYHNVESTIKYDALWLGGITIARNISTAVHPEQMELAHDMTDAIGYQVQIPIYLLAGIFILLWFKE